MQRQRLNPSLQLRLTMPMHHHRHPMQSRCPSLALTLVMPCLGLQSGGNVSNSLTSFLMHHSDVASSDRSQGYRVRARTFIHQLMSLILSFSWYQKFTLAVVNCELYLTHHIFYCIV